MPEQHPQDLVAAVDLGSNSFHMVVARLVHGQLQFVDRLRDRVALAAGLDADHRLAPEARDRALASLQRFGQRLRDFPPGTVRAVGTNTLRQARDSAAFMAQASELLGHPIEIISGREEARLVYLGVAHDVEQAEGRRLVVDIGGGSTECILGERFEPLVADSLYMGCVTWSRRFFPDGQITRDGMREAEIAARLELSSIEQRYKTVGWQAALGSSGTITAMDDILRATGSPEAGITLKGLRRIRKALLAAGHTSRVSLPGMPADRAPVLAGGLAILVAIFEGLEVAEMTAAHAALREGLLYDLLGRIRHEDVRDRTIERLQASYHVDVHHAARVERTALGLLRVVADDWGLAGPEAQRFLTWAARLHEIGLSIAYSGYQKHGAYIVENADMPGFSRDDQLLLAALIQGHRRKLLRERFKGVSPGRLPVALRLCVLLRLAVRLNRNRTARPLHIEALRVRKDRVELTFPPAWLDEHPLTRADLEAEATLLAPAGFELQIT
jgi:exopolyphosphatase/guanosine-5'-triphosphate,3'-diphosphate pyrophosphatase